MKSHDTEGADNELLGTYSGNDSDSHPPVEAKRLEDRFDGLAYVSYE